MPPKHTQLSYVRGIVGLMLWRMHRLMSDKGLSYSSALSDHADIYRKTAFFSLDDPAHSKRLKPRWEDLSARLKALFAERMARGEPSARIEDAGLELLWPHLLERIELGLPLVEYHGKAEFGCFYYRVEGAVADLHFTNAAMPESPFREPERLSRELSALVGECRHLHPQAARIKCGSWLNAYAPFRSLFPEAWRDSGEPKSENSLGWWGQFVRHDGDFHARNAEQFRRTGEFPYPCTFHQCALADLEAHLRAPSGR